MKKILLALTVIIAIASCKTSKDYLAHLNEDKTLSDVIKQLNKHSDDELAQAALPQVYKALQQKHLNNIELYNDRSELTKWNRIASSYQSLQDMYNNISNSAVAMKLVTPVNYQKEIIAVDEAAAEDYYQAGMASLDKNSRADFRNAYDYFKKSGSWIKDYKDAKVKMNDAYDNSIITVQINPVQDNSFFHNTSWGNTGYYNSREYFQQNLVNNLGGKYATKYPAKFYTELEASRDNVQPDWIVDLVVNNTDISRPVIYNYSRNRSKQIQVSSDTSGKPVYKTVYATVNIQRQSLDARGQMDVRITDANSRKSIAYDTYSNSYNWQQEVATYSGDSRALTSDDLVLINNSYNVPRREDILNELYRNIYPQVRNKISNEVNW